MEQIKNNKLVFKGVRQITTSNNKILNFLTLGDAEKFKSYDFIVDPQKVVGLANCTLDSLVTPVFEMDLYSNRTSFNLVELHPKK